MSLWWWVIYPYLSLAVLMVGSLYRYDSDQLGWTARSSEFLEKRRLRLGSLLFHWGVIFVFLGHVAGLLVPIEVYHALHVPDALYHATAMTVGGAAGLAAFSGLVLLLLRRLSVPRIRLTSSVMDILVLLLLGVTVGLGLATTLGYDTLVGPYEYRLTVGPWIRGILLLHPDPRLMAAVPLVLQLHIIAAFLVFALSPFTRLVHVWSLPLAYLRRAPQQVRRRGRTLADEGRGRP
jgi:nitrate reductase gamma subunit